MTGVQTCALPISDDKIDNILKSGAEAVVGCDVSCLMHIGGRITRRREKIRVVHLAQVLAGTKAG